MLISIIVGPPTAYILGIDDEHFLIVVASGVLVGILIDLDHFVIARLNTGNWTALSNLRSHPMKVLHDQSSIFSGEVGKLQRLLSHMLIGGAAFSIISIFSLRTGIFISVVIYFHIIGDIAADIREIDTPL